MPLLPGAGIFSTFNGSIFWIIFSLTYLTYKKEYLKAKAKYLRDVIDQKNDLTNQNEPFYSCVYDKWNSGEMPLSEANLMCGLKFEQN